jgi:hypothetical protein
VLDPITETTSLHSAKPDRLFSTARIRSALSKPAMPVFFFFAGVTYDGLTLTRIDRLVDNLLLFLYLALLGVLIAVTGRSGMMRAAGTPDAAGVDVPLPGRAARIMKRTQPYHPMAMQFLI